MPASSTSRTQPAQLAPSFTTLNTSAFVPQSSRIEPTVSSASNSAQVAAIDLPAIDVDLRLMIAGDLQPKIVACG